jgi:hypothetical protein
VAGQADRSGLTDRVRALSRASSWRLVSTIPVRFRTFHPQGMVKIGDTFIVSSVEVTTPTERFSAPKDGFDRSPGTGVGHLFKVDMEGRLVASVTLGEGSVYHPGGIDYDGRDLWVPVAEYRPDSRSILYRVDPITLNAAPVLRVADHIGGLVHNVDDRTLHGVSWGSRRFYRWPLGADRRIALPTPPLDQLRTLNPSHYVDYQDCHYAGARQMLCTGVADFRPAAGGPVFRLGGMDLVNLVDGRPAHQVPVPLWTESGRPMTQNPAWVDVTPTGLRAYFMPEDDDSRIYVYEATTTPSR